MSTDWDSKVVIGSKARAPKVTKTNSDINGAHHLYGGFQLFTDFTLQLYVLNTDIESYFYNKDLRQARRTGAVVATEKKVTGVTNKAHQGTPHITFS